MSRLICRKYNKKIKLVSYEDKENEIGEIEKDLIEIATVWAKIEPFKGKEYLKAKKIQASLIYKITIRYRKNIDTTMLIKYKEKTFMIQDIINVKEANKEFQIMCIEKGDKLGF